MAIIADPLFYVYFIHSLQTRSNATEWPSDPARIMKQLHDTFVTRKDRAMSQTVAEEVAECPPLSHPEYVSKSQ